VTVCGRVNQLGL